MAAELIINADDYGLSDGVRKGIIEAHRAGIVSSCSLLINIATSEDIDSLRQFSNLGVGIHINLTRGPAMSSSRLGTLVDTERHFVVGHRNGFQDVDEECVRAEIDAQVDAALATGLPNIDHLDTHHHIHRHHLVFDIVKELAVKNGLAVRAVAPWMVDELREAGVWCNGHFIDYFFGQANTTVGKLDEIITGLDDGVTELMCHPGYGYGVTRIKSGYINERAVELETLMNPSILDTIRENGVQLARFKPGGKNV